MKKRDRRRDTALAKARDQNDPEFRARRRAQWRNWARKKRKDPAFREYTRQRVNAARKRNPEVYLLQSAKARAKKQGLPFALTPTDVLIPMLCPVLGIPLDRRSRDHWPSIDRGVPRLGYIRGNVQVISYRANRIKNDATVSELEAIAKYARRFHHVAT